MTKVTLMETSLPDPEPTYWVDEEQISAAPPKGVIVCESLEIVSAHLRHLPHGSRAILIIVLGPELKSVPVKFDVPPGGQVTVAIDNQSGYDLAVSEASGPARKSTVGVS
jgi:hypothetical protein